MAGTFLSAAAAVLVVAQAAAAETPRTRLGPLGERPRGGGRVTLNLKSPTARIGLTGDDRILSLDSAGGLYIVDRDTGRDVWKHIHKGPVRIVLERGGAPESSPIYRVQVASLASQEEAEALKARLETQTGEVALVTRNPDRKAWRVRVGQRASREEIKQVEDKLRDLGYNEIWVVPEGGPAGRESKLRLVDQDYNDMLTSSKALLVLPAAEGRPLKLADQPYRGVFEVLLTRQRELQAVNILNVEDYLRGVVPKELGPTLYPELEALKAQAVAARTYLEANRGQFDEDGYDICDSARCQVYGGLSAEHPLSDFAVEQTDGTIATFEGRPINALYTATCGGHTEDLKNVFKEMEGPYLKGVDCYADEAGLVAARRTLKGAWGGSPVTLPGGERIDEAVSMLEALGVLTPSETTPQFLAGFPTSAETGGWTTRTLKAAGKRVPAGFDPAREPRDVAALADYLIGAFEWSERIGLLIDPRDLPAFLGASPLEAT
ncbi:MAG TPA: SpoIID/LytB domain-containing protein, partial [Patescibacteria group bacterium]|nr:SpoIID/LytB domain-containing protein [Patescibacteria group bacterium]